MTGVFVVVVDQPSDLIIVHSLGLEFALDLGPPLLERVRDVLEEDEPEDDVLVLRGIHRAAELVGRLPQACP